LLSVPQNPIGKDTLTLGALVTTRPKDYNTRPASALMLFYLH